MSPAGAYEKNNIKEIPMNSDGTVRLPVNLGAASLVDAMGCFISRTAT